MARATVREAATVEDLDLADAPRGAIARGLGRSYGDCAQNSGGTVFDVTPMSSVELDPVGGIITAAGGTSLGKILEVAVPAGWFLPVTPGTKQVSLGGAMAADVHGKNHHRDGSIGAHVRQFDLYTAAGETITVEPGTDTFDATLGGLGLTGIITRVSIKLIPIATAKVIVATERTANLDVLMTAMVEGDDHYRYSVAWIDLMANGSGMGRGVLTRGDHAPLDAIGSSTRPLAYRDRKRPSVPDVFPSGLLNRKSVRAFNELWFRKTPRQRVDEIQSINQFFYPLDLVENWNRLYGPKGFVQYQFALPTGAEETLRAIIGDLSERGFPSFLAVLKRFGRGTGLLSFPIEGWTLALDVPAGVPGLAGALTGFDEQIAAAGGRVYLAKDSRLRPELFRAMYPDYPIWGEIRDRLDPKGVWRSDLTRRLEMI